MTNNNTETPKSAPKKLQLTKTIESGQVQQNFARGKSKTVTVEVKKTRTFSRGSGGVVVENIASNRLQSSLSQESDPFEGLNESEKAARLKALKALEAKEIKDAEKAELKALEDAEKATAEKAAAKEEAAKKSAEAEEATQKDESEQESSDKSDEKETESPPKRKLLRIIEHAPEVSEDEKVATSVVKNESETQAAPSHSYKKKSVADEYKKPAKKSKLGADSRRTKGKLTISNAFDNPEERMRSLASLKRKRQKQKRQIDGNVTQEKAIREIVIPESISVTELANRMAVRATDVVKELMKLGIMSTGNDLVDADTSEIIVTEFGHKFKRVTDADVEDILKEEVVDPQDLEHCAPVVTIMGHVDHGKTSLLDALRNTNVTAGEAGGITQHIGAYQIKTDHGDRITFLDTPGHAAFTSMRARGANITDIVILVVAADDGIMPQTEEAINHAKAADVPIIVAINKIDKPDSNPQKVRDALLLHELIPEELGGDIQIIEVSAKSKLNLDKLIEAILIQSEMLELTASTKQRAAGAVVESRIDKSRGVIATLLVQRGTLKIGDIVVAGTGYGKVKTITNDLGQTLGSAGPSLPVEVLGLNELPGAGDTFSVIEHEKQARDIIEYREKLQRDLKTASQVKSIESLFQTAKGGGKELRIIIKSDVNGSCEAIIGSLDKLNNEEVEVKVIHSAAGGITESDVALANATGAIILGFNVRADPSVCQFASDESVDIRYYSIIYNLIDDMRGVVSGLMSPIIREQFIGNALIQEIFKMSKYGKVAGCLVKEGTIKRGAGVRLIRDNVVIHEGKLKTLKRFKEDVNDVREGTECGMAFENYEDIKEGDFIEAFELIEEAVELKEEY